MIIYMFKNNWPLILAVVINLTASTLGDVCAKMWGLTGNQRWFYIALPINIVTIVAFMFIIRFGGLAIPTTIVLILTILINVTLGFIFFKEAISVQQWIGITLALVAIPLLLGVFSYSRVQN
jgi:drug/metabolite transporter (DMT)-like permease